MVELSSTYIVAVPTSADVFTKIGTDTVPQGVKRLKKVAINLSPDHGTSAISVRQAPILRLTGDGLGEQSPHDYLGKFGGVAVTTSGAIAQQQMKMTYDVDIPVVTGGSIQADVDTLDEAITAGTITVELTYDDQAPKAMNSMAQYIDSAGDTTADRWTQIGTIRIPQPEAKSAPKKIVKIVIGCAPDQGTSAISLRGALRVRLSGDGLKDAGKHEYSANGFTGAQVTPGAIWVSDGCTVMDVNLDINAGGSILVEHQFDVETPTASTVAVGFIYA